jgi:hypothetical protein
MGSGHYVWGVVIMYGETSDHYVWGVVIIYGEWSLFIGGRLVKRAEGKQRWLDFFSGLL